MIAHELALPRGLEPLFSPSESRSWQGHLRLPLVFSRVIDIFRPWRSTRGVVPEPRLAHARDHVLAG